MDNFQTLLNSHFLHNELMQVEKFHAFENLRQIYVLHNGLYNSFAANEDNFLNKCPKLQNCKQLDHLFCNKQFS